MAYVQANGIAGYLDEQFAAPLTQYTGYSYTPAVIPTNCRFDPAAPFGASSTCARAKYTLFQVQRDFFTHALNNPDQLRQRVAFALSHIFVTSGVDILQAYGMANYQNLLLRDAFGNFRALLQDVTLSPTMGAMLNMANNAKANATLGTAANENYAREILQLFSIGLVQLNPDGTQALGVNGVSIPTYTQGEIQGLAAVFTGWTYQPVAGVASKWINPLNYDGVMTSFPAYHDPGTKLLLNGVTVPPGQTPTQDLTLALDTIFNHPNVGPFIGKQLIQHLVTSNPSPAYVARISAVFANNGHGVRGDLSAVVRAILTDSEARGDAPVASNFGRLREPALFITSVLRGLGGVSDGVYPRLVSEAMGEPIFAPETVFDFYTPAFEIPGTQTMAPQFEIDDATTALARLTFIQYLIVSGGIIGPDPRTPGSTGTTVSLAPYLNLPNLTAVVTQMNQLLMHGSLSSAASAIIVNAAQAQSPKLIPNAAVYTALYLLLTSSQYQVER